MAKHLIDLDEDAVNSARAELGTSTLKDTVNEALRRAGASRAQRVVDALDALGTLSPGEREDAWR